MPTIGAVVALAAALVWAGHRSATERRVRIGCGLLKIAGIALLALALLEPLWVGQRARPGANFFALLADNSQSLQMKDAGESQSRGEILRKALTTDAKGWQSALEENFQVRRYTFDSRLQNVRDFNELNFDGRASALGNALKTSIDRWRGQPVAGVLLFTDGNATDLGADLPALEGCPPVYPVVLGKDSDLTDISLNKIGVSQTAFEDAPVTIQAAVAASGFAGKEIVARLTEVAVGRTSLGTNQTDAAGIIFRAQQTPRFNCRNARRARSRNWIFVFKSSPTAPACIFMNWKRARATSWKIPTRLRARRRCSTTAR